MWPIFSALLISAQRYAPPSSWFLLVVTLARHHIRPKTNLFLSENEKKFFLSKSWYQTAGVVGVCFQISFGERMDNLTHSFGVGFDTVRHFGMISETMAAAINCGQCTETQKWCLGLLVGVQRLFKSVESQNTGFGCWEDTKVEGDPEAQRDKGRQTKRKLKRQNPLSFFFCAQIFTLVLKFL